MQKVHVNVRFDSFEIIRPPLVTVNGDGAILD
jgi:hypothetical protein